MNTKHTPGPWVLAEVKNETGRITHLVPVDSEKLSLLTVVDDGKTCFGAVYLDSDARLIAAAPDLLQELKNIANANTVEWDDPTEFEAWAKNRARAAIAKATGEQA